MPFYKYATRHVWTSDLDQLGIVFVAAYTEGAVDIKVEGYGSMDRSHKENDKRNNGGSLYGKELNIRYLHE